MVDSVLKKMNKERLYVGHLSFPFVGDLNEIKKHLDNRIKDAEKEVKRIVLGLDLENYHLEFELDREEIKATYINIYLVYENDEKYVLKEEIKEYKKMIKDLEKRLKEIEE